MEAKLVMDTIPPKRCFSRERSFWTTNAAKEPNRAFCQTSTSVHTHGPRIRATAYSLSDRYLNGRMGTRG